MQQEFSLLAKIIVGLKELPNSDAGLQHIFREVETSQQELLLKTFIDCGETTRKDLSDDERRVISTSIENAIFLAEDKDHEEVLALNLECDQQLIEVFEVPFAHDQVLRKLKPGYYTLQTSSGWLLWEEYLSSEELIWTYAFPEQDLPLAADTDDADEVLPSKEIELLDGEIQLLIYPGLESGVMKIKVVG
ncbi:hypothetical protein KAI46_01405 [bacterium]|nr:hypothetical protein [bacterium]